LLWLYCSGSGSVSGNVLKRMSRHTVVTLNSDSRTCNAEAVHKWTQTGTSDKCRKTVRAVYTHVVNVTGVTADAAWTPPVIRHPLVPLREHSRPGWFLERRRTCRHLQTTEDAGIAVNDLELPAGAVELDGTPESSTMPRVILKNVFNLPSSLWVWSGSQPMSLTIADTEVGGLVRRWGTLLTNLAALYAEPFPAGPRTFAGMDPRYRSNILV